MTAIEQALDELATRLGDLSARGVVLEPGQTLASLYDKRTPLYAQWADVTVNLSGLGHDQAVEAVIRRVEQSQTTK
jgi:shikimate kinase